MDKTLRFNFKNRSGIKFNKIEKACFEQNFDYNMSLIESITKIDTKDVKPYCQPMTDYELLREDTAKTNS